MTKKLFTILSIAVLIFAFSACAAKAQSYQGDQNEIVMTIDSKEVSLFGQKTQNDVAPIISNGRTMLPARLVAEALGANVLWDENQRKVTVTRNDITIEMYVDSDIVYINGKKHKLDSTVFIQDSRTYTPVRFIAELLDAKVSWLGETRQVVISKEPLVAEAVNYTKRIIDYNGLNIDYGNHKISIPKITITTPAAEEFNQKIYSAYEDILNTLKNGTEQNMIYEISYQYAVNNGVVAILVQNLNARQASGASDNYDGYYFDTSSDKELSFAEYLSRLNVDFKKLTNETNAIYEATADQYDDHDLVASLSSKNRVENALLSPGKVIVSHYSNHGVAVGDRLVELDCSVYDVMNLTKYNKIQATAQVVYSKDLTLIDLHCEYIPGGVVAELNEGAIGGIKITYTVTAPKNTCRVIVRSISNIDDFKTGLPKYSEHWINSDSSELKKEGTLKLKDVPFETWQNYPLYKNDSTELFRFYEGFDANGDFVGYSIVKVILDVE